MLGNLVNVERLLKDKIKESTHLGDYQPVLPDGTHLRDLDTVTFLEFAASVQDNATKARVPFRVDTVNEALTLALLGYFDDPGYDEDGLPYWHVEVSGRQSTKSTVAAYGITTAAMRTPGAEAFILADTNERAKYLYQRARELHRYLPPSIRAPMESRGSEKRMKFHPEVGGSLDFFSAERQGGMVGYSGKLGQISEIPFMQDPAKSLSVLLPAMYHQTDSRLVLESTPAPPSYNGAAYWQNLVVGALDKKSRFKVHFSPFWESKLNRKTWKDEDTLTTEELRLLDQYGHLGLSRANLAFRRSVLETDDELRRNPELFEVWYPFSLTTCWGGGNVGLFPAKVLLKHTMAMNSARNNPEEMEPHRLVVIGADPAGLLGGADHAAMTVLACDQEDWDVREVYSDCVTTHEFVEELISTAEKYREVTGKWPYIAVESNGVGAATLALLIERKYPRIFCESSRRPGVTATKKKNAQMVAETCDALLDYIKPLWSLPLLMQLQTYSGDRQKRTTELSMLINGIAKGRRSRQHWDLASSFMLAVHAAMDLPKPRPPAKETPLFIEPKALTPQDYQKLREQEEEDQLRRERRDRIRKRAKKRRG